MILMHTDVHLCPLLVLLRQLLLVCVCVIGYAEVHFPLWNSVVLVPIKLHTAGLKEPPPLSLFAHLNDNQLQLLSRRTFWQRATCNITRDLLFSFIFCVVFGVSEVLKRGRTESVHGRRIRASWLSFTITPAGPAQRELRPNEKSKGLKDDRQKDVETGGWGRGMKGSGQEYRERKCQSS